MREQQKYLALREKSEQPRVYIMLDLWSKNVVSLVNALGAGKIDETGVYSTMMAGSLFGKNKNFAFFQEKPSSVSYSPAPPSRGPLFLFSFV